MIEKEERTMKAEVDLPENVQTTTSSYHENNVGGIEFDMIHFDHTSELSCKIRVYDDRPVPGKTGWGKCYIRRYNQRPTKKTDWTIKVLVFLTSLFNIYVRQCGWCRCILGFKRGGKGVTHGICPKCVKNLS